MGFFSSGELLKKAEIKVDISQLEADCVKCGLYKGCSSPKMPVSGDGKKKILIIGEAPGAEEDEYGIHFVGRAGQFLQNSLRNIKISLNRDCWKINAVNCRPPGNETPTHREIKACYPYVERTIRELKPKVILLLGNVSITSLLGQDFSNRKISRWRANIIPDEKFKCFIIPLFHPSYLIRNEKDMNLHSVFERDLKKVSVALKRTYTAQKNYEQYVTVLKDFNKVKRLLTHIIQQKSKIAIDYETTGIKPYKEGHKLISIGIAVSSTKAFSFPFNYKSFWTEQEFTEIKKLWKSILANKDIKKIAHNYLFEDMWSKIRGGARIKGWYWDTQLGQHILDNTTGITGLKFQTYVRYGIRPYDKIVKPFLQSKTGEFNTIEKAPFKELLIYNGLDCIYTWMLYEDQKRKFGGMNKLSKAFGFFMRGLHVMNTIHFNGIKIDVEYYKKTKEKFIEQITKNKKYLESGREAGKFQKHFGRPIKITSNQDLGKLFYEILGKDPIYTNAKQINYKTDKPTLETLNLPFVDKLLDMKRFEKAKGTYLAQFAREVYKNKIHPFFGLTIPRSYRSCIAGYEKVPIMKDFESEPDGIPIKDIRSGDYVYCLDDNLNPQIKKVLWQGKTGNREIIRIHYYRKGKRGHFDCTPEHRVRLINGEYVEAQNLLKKQHYKRVSYNEGKCRVLACRYNPKNHVVTKVEWINKKVDVYDIEVEDCHNFFVNEICVHNSSFSPNMQNLPKRDPEISNSIRKGIIPSPNSVLCEADFASSEVITSVCYHKDKNFYNYLVDPSTDMHADNASDLWILPSNMLNNPKYNDEQKKLAKNIRFYAKNCWTFAQFYGDWYASCGKNLWDTCVVHNLKLPNGVFLKDHLENYGIFELGEVTKEGPTPGSFLEHCAHVEDKMWNERFPEYTQWKKDIVKFYQRYGYIETFFGFRFVGYMDKKQCTNYPIQSTSFHLLLYALILIDNSIRKNKLNTKIIGQIHDSCILDIPLDEIKFVTNKINEIVTGLKDKLKWLIIPMEIEIELSKSYEKGGNFAEMKEYSLTEINENW